MMTKAIIPVAGTGSRLGDITKVIPKEYMPVNGKPAVYYAVKEAVDAGFTDIILITNPRKPDFVKYLADEFEANFITINQRAPQGLGHAVLLAKNIIGTDPFAVLLPDEVIIPGVIGLLRSTYLKKGDSIIATMRVPASIARNYGIVGLGKDHKVIQIEEKPSLTVGTPLAIIGRYILHPEVFTILEGIGPGADYEIQLTDALAELRPNLSAVNLNSEFIRYDVGSQKGWLKANWELDKIKA